MQMNESIGTAHASMTARTNPMVIAFVLPERDS